MQYCPPYLFPDIRAVQRKLRQDVFQQPQPQQKLVFIVRLKYRQADPEQLHENIHLVILRGLVLQLQTLSRSGPPEAVSSQGCCIGLEAVWSSLPAMSALRVGRTTTSYVTVTWNR